VLAALEVERHKKRTLDLATQATLGGTGPSGTIAQATALTLESLMMTSLETQLGTGNTVTAQMTDGGKKASKAFGNAWRGSAAYHFYMLAQKQFYEGKSHI
jgi:hypothetical protein